MNIKVLNKLTKKQINDIEHLVDICLLADGLERKLYLNSDYNFNENLNSFYLLYDEKKLISVLTIFEPSEVEAELSAYTLPEERNKGYFTKLLYCAKKELLSYNKKDIFFVVEPKSMDGMHVLKKNAVFFKSEYLLALEFNRWNQSEETDASLELREFQLQNKKEAAELSTAIFSTEVEENLEILEESYDSDQMQSYCLYQSSELIGICHVNYGISSACLFGLGISPQCQGKGYGKKLVNLILSEIFQKKEIITLQVSSENQKAFHLYQNIGFTIKTQYDYYKYTD